VATRRSNPTATSDQAASDARQLTEVVNRLRRTLRAGIRHEFPWEVLPMAQVELLQCLDEHDALRVGEISARLHLAPATTSGLVQQLVEAGMARRAPDPQDRRVSLVRLTLAGRRQLVRWEAANERRLGGALDDLSAADRAALRAALPALRSLVETLRDADEQA
jgi:DNA-binding MarR family transcriptional regulator